LATEIYWAFISSERLRGIEVMSNRKGMVGKEARRLHQVLSCLGIESANPSKGYGVAPDVVGQIEEGRVMGANKKHITTLVCARGCNCGASLCSLSPAQRHPGTAAPKAACPIAAVGLPPQPQSTQLAQPQPPAWGAGYEVTLCLQDGVYE